MIRHRYVLGEFRSPAALLEALPAVRDGRHGEIEVHSPFPLHGVDEILGWRPSPIPAIVLAGGTMGLVTAFLFQWWCNAVDYPLNVGGRPLFSLPSWVPIMFELMVLFGSLAGFFGLWALSGLPSPFHPTGRLERFRSATLNGYWIRVRLRPGDDEGALDRRLRELGAIYVDRVEGEELP